MICHCDVYWLMSSILYDIVIEYTGNNFYCTLGNVQSSNTAGLFFPCFKTGDVLHVTAIATNLYDYDADQIMSRTSMVTTFKVSG